MDDSISQDRSLQQVYSVIDRLVRDGFIVAESDGSEHDIFPVAVNSGEGQALLKWIEREGATQTIEIGLGYGISALHICAGLVANALSSNEPVAAQHVVMDPFQKSRFANCGRQILEEAGVWSLVDYHNERSEILLPYFLKEGRQFDLGFVDGNHRFDGVFVDLFYLGRLVRKGGIILLDDYHLPGIQHAVSFFETNLGWTIEEKSSSDDKDCWVALRTATREDNREYRYYVEF